MRGKKLVALLLALGTCFAVAACDDDQSTNTPDSGNTSVSSSASAGDSSNSSSSNGSSDSSSSNSSSTTPAVETTVTATEWVDALDMKGETNWSCNTTMRQGEMQATQLVEFDGATIHEKGLDGDEYYYYKEGSDYFRVSNGIKDDCTKDEYEDMQKTSMNGIFTFDKFTYDDTAKAYKAPSISFPGGGSTYTDVVLKFEDGRFTYYSMTMSFGENTITADATFIYGETETITVPTAIARNELKAALSMANEDNYRIVSTIAFNGSTETQTIEVNGVNVRSETPDMVVYFTVEEDSKGVDVSYQIAADGTRETIGQEQYRLARGGMASVDLYGGRYDETDGAYKFNSLNVNGMQCENVAIVLENNRVASMRYDLYFGGEFLSSVSAVYIYDCVEEITLPSAPVVETTVTATEWADALDMTGATNYTIDAVTVVGESTESLHFAEFDGKTVHVIENNSTETFYYKESNNYFKIEGGVKKTSTQDEYVSATKQTAGFSAHLAFNQFTYDETDKAYKADSIYVREEEQYSNLVFKFENGKLVYYSVVVATQWGPVHTTATFTYGETETIQLPTVA